MNRSAPMRMSTVVSAVCVTLGTFVVVSLAQANFIPTIRVPKLEHERMQQVRVLFVGDMMFDRYIRTTYEQKGGGHILGRVSDLLARADVNVGNLEGPITDYPTQSTGTKVGDATNMRFTFSPRIRDILLENNFGLVSIGNNHIRDYGTDGVRQTTAYLSGTNIDYVGDPTGSGVEPVYKEVNGVRIAFVSYSDFAFGDAERARAALRSASSTADFVVLMTHWGNEYESTPPMRVRQLAYGFVAAGADLIIGTHSHVIGEVEELAGRRIYYSLGNFIFDQYWMPEVRCGLTVLATVTKKDGVTTAAYAETPVGMDTDGSTGPVCS